MGVIIVSILEENLGRSLRDPLFLLDIGHTMKNICFISFMINALVRYENIDINNAIYTQENKFGNTNVYAYAYMHRTIISEKGGHRFERGQKHVYRTVLMKKEEGNNAYIHIYLHIHIYPYFSKIKFRERSRLKRNASVLRFITVLFVDVLLWHHTRCLSLDEWARHLQPNENLLEKVTRNKEVFQEEARQMKPLLFLGFIAVPVLETRNGSIVMVGCTLFYCCNLACP